MKDYMQVQAKLNKLRLLMQEKHLDAYLVLSSDFHNSEYVGSYFKCREYLSGFTGSAGSVIVTQSEAGLWTDGRYFLQAEQELSGSGIVLYRMGEENVPKPEEYLKEHLEEGACLGVDGRTISISAYRKLEKKLSRKKISICTNLDLIGELWSDRPQMSCEPVWELDLCYAGKTRAQKLCEVRKELKKKGADGTVISSLEDIAWTLNIRGKDAACTPVVLSFLMISMKDAVWFVQRGTVSEKLIENLKSDGITVQNYQDIYVYLADKLQAESLYLDPEHTSWFLYENARKSSGTILEDPNVTMMLKAVKNAAEIENMRKAHVKDAAACIKFIYWLKKQMQRKAAAVSEEEKKAYQVTEISAAEKLEEFRQQQEHYLGASFDTIAGYAQHGAIVHYSASADTDAVLEPQNLILVDSGGHYLEGTTDITRTIALGPLTEKQKHHYTLVLKGNLRLAAAKFKYGCAGINLDYLAREAMWKEGLDYNHGTGHGVGYLLSVHEPPNSFRTLVTESRYECMKLEAGMVTSDEPGLYMTGEYGIRLENLILCREDEKNEYGKFMKFETLTLVPFEREAILVQELDECERKWLNEYHAMVFEKVSGCLEEEEKKWLSFVTAPL